ncbi:hypothetical protein RO3G_11656 [Lichtheimia corymbifera JMRC:FSU:9682]|uniref:Uncharacterized protein n=1 Tax=Lichtheimia corymbifera JMRC:FSU:9682 TaxID=1263082 RepID=A0A068S975_9FUNG|nr:hypothetical protein RO3G_11656 [Lichtheimia corymbifera JMRC:FSU:9682]
MEDNKAPEVPMPCTAGCGFYGNKIYNNMCSKCFREQAEQNKQPITDAKPAPSSTPINNNNLDKQPVSATTPPPPPSNNLPALAPASPQQDKEQENNKEDTVKTADESSPPESAQRPVQKSPGRCFMCRAKIPLAKQVSNKCRCDYVFCDSHRYPDKHDCDFDHASMDKDILAKKNPKLNERPRGGRSFQRLDSL